MVAARGGGAFTVRRRSARRVGCSDTKLWRAKLSVCIPTCGDGIATIGEEFDLGVETRRSATAGAPLDCRIGPHCGDGILQPEFGENCDRGERNDELCVCRPECAINLR